MEWVESRHWSECSRVLIFKCRLISSVYQRCGLTVSNQVVVEEELLQKHP